jgi:hypothetical protein
LKAENKELVDAVSAFLTLGEASVFGDKSEEEIKHAKSTLQSIAKRKGITVAQLCERVKDIIKKSQTV